MRKGQVGSIAITLFAIIFIIIGVQIAVQTVSGSTSYESATESLTYNTAPALQSFTLTTVEDGVVTSTFVLTNGSVNFTSPTDYNVTSAGTVSFVNVSNQSLTASYSYKPTGYIDAGTTRTLIIFIPLFIGLAALFMAAMLVMRQ